MVRAVEIVEQALELYGAPIYVLHQIVHNQKVIHDLGTRGVIFTEDRKSIPPGTVTVLSAHGPDLSDICYATQNRQNAVRNLAAKVDVILVVGARNSSNSSRLQEVGEMSGVDAYLIQDADEISPNWFVNGSQIGVTAGASTPEVLVQGVLDRLRNLGVTSIHEMEGVFEDNMFKLPTALLRHQKSLEV